MKKSFIYLFLFTTLSSFFIADHPAIELLEKFEAYNIETFEEKPFLHLDKPYYAAGETIWFKAYLANGMNLEPDTLSVPLYVELLNLDQGVIIDQKTIKLEVGFGNGEFDLVDTLVAGNYQVRAYTNWMKNFDSEHFFSQNIKVLDFGSQKENARANDKMDFQFFPEGGNLIAELQSKIAFKATDQYGNGVDADGYILNMANDTIIKFSTIHLGMGSLNFTAFAGEKYRAFVRKEKEPYSNVSFPEVLQSGYSCIVDNLSNAANTKVYFSKSDDIEAEQVAIIAQSAGVVYYSGLINFSQKMVPLSIPKKDFPTGVAQITLVDSEGRPRCERLVFMHSDKVAKATISKDQNYFSQRELVKLELDVKDENGNPLEGEFSLAVTDAFQINKALNSESIMSNYYLSSHLKGFVQDPMQYFDLQNKQAGPNLEMLMLTQGWRRFTWQDVIAKESVKTPNYFERGLSLTGNVKNPNGKSFGKPLSVTTILKDTEGNSRMLMGETDNEGDFAIYDLAFENSVELLFQTALGKNNRTSIVVLNDPSTPSFGNKNALFKLQKDTGLDSYLKNTKTDQDLLKSMLNTNQLLNEVVVSAKKRDSAQERVVYNRRNATTVQVGGNNVMSNYINVLQAISGRIPGVSVTGPANNPTVQIRGISSLSGSSEPLYLVDGSPVDKEVILAVNMNDVDKIDVLKGPAAAIFGSRGSNGVISVLTKRGNEDYDYSQDSSSGMTVFRKNGYNKAKVFYQPNYEENNLKRPDFRSTVAWEPIIRTDKNGKAFFSFYATDASTQLDIDLQGLSFNGKPVATRMKVEVR